MKVRFKGLTCPGCRACEEAVAHVLSEKVVGQIRQLSLLLMILSAAPALIADQYVLAVGCAVSCLTVFFGSFFAVRMQYAHSAVREGFANRWVCHTHLYSATDTERVRLAVTTIVIDYRFGRVIQVEHPHDGITVETKLVGGRIACQYPPHGERRVSSIRSTLTEIAAYEPPRSA